MLYGWERIVVCGTMPSEGCRTRMPTRDGREEHSNELDASWLFAVAHFIFFILFHFGLFYFFHCDSWWFANPTLHSFASHGYCLPACVLAVLHPLAVRLGRFRSSKEAFCRFLVPQGVRPRRFSERRDGPRDGWIQFHDGSSVLTRQGRACRGRGRRRRRRPRRRW